MPQGATNADRPTAGETHTAQVMPRDGSDFLVVGIGASAGGLNACRAFLDALPVASGAAFILVQHLDPTHESMMVDLLGGRAAITLRQATNGMPIEPDHLMSFRQAPICRWAAVPCISLTHRCGMVRACPLISCCIH